MFPLKRFLLPTALATGLLLAAPPAHAAPGEKYPQTKTRVLTNAEIARLSSAQHRYAINEIYARHGFNFGDVSLRKQFLPYAWYKPVPGMTQTQAQKRFSKTEKRNVDRLSLAREVAGNNADDSDDNPAPGLNQRDYASPYKIGSQGLAGEHFPETRLDALDDGDAYAMTDAQLRYAINEIYARHGFNFGDMALRKQFLKFGWYHPKPGVAMTAVAKTFSPRERVNAQLLTQERDDRN